MGSQVVGSICDPKSRDYLTEMYAWAASARQPPAPGSRQSSARERGELPLPPHQPIGRGRQLFFQALRELMAADDGDVIIGEWGIAQQDLAASPGGLSAV